MELLNLDIQLMATLWENTYRAAIKDQNGNYVASVRIIVNVPLSPDRLPPNAPKADPQLFVLVEDAVMESEDIIQFETLLSVHIREKFKNEIDQIYFFYPSRRCAKQNCRCTRSTTLITVTTYIVL